MAVAPYDQQQWMPARPVISHRRALRLVRLILIAGAVLVGLWWLLSHDPASGLALSPRGWITVALVAVLVGVVVREHDRGRVARDVLVFAVAVLLVTSSGGGHSSTPTKAEAAQAAKRATAQAAGFGDGCPEVTKVRAWLECLSKQAKAKADQKGGQP